jgi:hypothetical protein
MKSNLVFITVDTASYNFIKRSMNACYLYSELRSLSFCYQQEVWVMYSDAKYFETAMQFARRVQQAGSLKVLILLINPFYLEKTYVSNNNRITPTHAS